MSYYSKLNFTAFLCAISKNGKSIDSKENKAAKANEICKKYSYYFKNGKKHGTWIRFNKDNQQKYNEKNSKLQLSIESIVLIVILY
ncbi:MAG: hypothetical protein K0R54_4536 [Clostridiaceae bacterium]|jgi:hypothetical protein|nr:hypothetical protein [Clostridiaceae bacterium]